MAFGHEKLYVYRIRDEMTAQDENESEVDPDSDSDLDRGKPQPTAGPNAQ